MSWQVCLLAVVCARPDSLTVQAHYSKTQACQKLEVGSWIEGSKCLYLCTHAHMHPQAEALAAVQPHQGGVRAGDGNRRAGPGHTGGCGQQDRCVCACALACADTHQHQCDVTACCKGAMCQDYMQVDGHSTHLATFSFSQAACLCECCCCPPPAQIWGHEEVPRQAPTSAASIR